jgi:hypothetical protein
MCDELDSQGLIPVQVVKPFEATRTPCPPKGTYGEIYRFDGDYVCVRFPLPMIDTDGDVWHSHGDNTDFMRLKFKFNEISEI